MEPIIKVTGLSRHFKDIVAVKNLSFTVYPGDVYGFLGQNGAGKSTTIRMLLTLVQPTDGKIEMFGMDLSKHRKEILKNVGAVIEKPDVYKFLTAYENLRLFARLSGAGGQSKQQLMEKLEMVGLHERAHSKVKTYSQGMKQRLGVAIALIHDPGLVILDEPTNGLDPQGIADIRNLILHLSHNMNKTVVVSSHLLSEIELIANRVLIIDSGEKIVEGTAAELFDPSQTIIQLDTLDNAATLSKLRQSEWSKFLQPTPNGSILLKMDRQQIPALHQSLAAMDVPLLSLQPRHTLEDFFLQVTTGKQHVEAFTD